MIPLIEPYGPDAFLVRFTSQDGSAFSEATRRCQLTLLEWQPRGLIESTPGFEVLLMEFARGERPDPAEFLQGITERIHSDLPAGRPPKVHQVPVLYDGPDLATVACHANLTPAEVIRRHTAATYAVRILGFSPGFPYLSGLDPSLATPRRASPRARIEAGAVAIGGHHTGIYPAPTAGGWNLIGQTSINLLDPRRTSPGHEEAFLLHPGDEVRFHAVHDLAETAPPPMAGRS